MDINRKLNECYGEFVKGAQQEAIAVYLSEGACALAGRNHEMLRAEDRKVKAKAELEKYQTELGVVSYVEDSASKAGVGVDEFISTLPDGFRAAYRSAHDMIGEHLKAARGFQADPLTVDVIATAYNNQARLYLPVLWDEKQTEVLPGVLFMHLLTSATAVAASSGAEMSDAADYKGIVSLVLACGRPDDVASDIARRLSQGTDELAAANVSIDAKVLLLSGAPYELKTIASAPIIIGGSSSGRTYSLPDAARVWLEHDQQQGTSRGKQGIYQMIMGTRVAEGRLATDAEGKVLESSLKDLLQYADIKTVVDKRIADGAASFSVDEFTRIMRMDRSALADYVTSGVLRATDEGEVTVHSLRTFMRFYTIRDGHWEKFEKTLLKRTKNDNLRPIKKARGHYMSTDEAATVTGQAATTILKLAKDGQLQPYFDGDRKKFLFDRREVRKYFSGAETGVNEGNSNG
ncbi:helix-turn-helix domain-containing protein [Candidatus Woesearchaeota archaeon]|nr:helix-turn-helix domain-containing protein [Candidatus Woesearchaeota archaeon]